jgi:hypothetical protein
VRSHCVLKCELLHTVIPEAAYTFEAKAKIRE